MEVSPIGVRPDDAIKNSKILIFGASQGIGLGVADAMLNAGCKDLYISSSNNAKLLTAKAMLQERHPTKSIMSISCDLSDSETAEANIMDLLRQVAPAESSSRKIDHTIFCAGDPVNLEPLSERTLPSMVQSGMVRFYAPLLVAKHLAAHSNRSVSATFTVTGGIIAQRPLQGWLLHSAYYAALEAAVRCLALELKPLRVNVVSPGPVDTAAWGNIPTEMREELRRVTEPRCITGRMATVEEVAEAFLYCIRNRNSTGSVIVTDGGVAIMP